MKLFMKALLLLSGSGLIFLFPSAAKVRPQNSERVMAKAFVPSQPIEILEIRNKKAKVFEQGKIEDDDEWMDGLTVGVKNTSGKAITYVQVELFFPKAENLSDSEEPPLAFFLYFGTREKPDASAARPSLGPGEVTELTLSTERYGILKRTLQEMKYSKGIKKVRMSVQMVIFEDDLMWLSGQMMRRDPNDPDTWVRIRQSRAPTPPAQKKLTTVGAGPR